MSRFINYERIEGTYDQKGLKKVFVGIVEKGWEIIYYNEKIMDTDKIFVVIICGIPNEMSK